MTLKLSSFLLVVIIFLIIKVSIIPTMKSCARIISENKTDITSNNIAGPNIANPPNKKFVTRDGTQNNISKKR
ncbi:hypothetical protein KAJ38_00800 [Candidatus Pacearchaeota archaeon]|nr:hypothetical protein [Candidatus Pacearchaeota archaeon]